MLVVRQQNEFEEHIEHALPALKLDRKACINILPFQCLMLLA